MTAVTGAYNGTGAAVTTMAGQLVSALRAGASTERVAIPGQARPLTRAVDAPPAPRAAAPPRAARVPTPIDANGKISQGAQRVLNAVAYLRTIGIDDAPAGRVAAIAGASPKLSTWRGYLSELRANGYLEGLRLTAAGEQIALLEHVPTSTAELHAFALEKLSAGAKNALTALLEAYPAELERDQVAAAVPVDPGISTFRGYVAELNKFGYLDSVGRRMRAASFLFLEAAP